MLLAGADSGSSAQTAHMSIQVSGLGLVKEARVMSIPIY